MLDVSWNFCSVEATICEMKKDRNIPVIWVEEAGHNQSNFGLSVDDAYELINELERKLVDIRAAEG